MRTSKTQIRFLVKAGLIVGAGGLIFGYDIGVISGTLSQLKDEFGLSDFEQGLVVSILYGGSILGSLVGGPMCDYLGRWKTIHIQNAIFILGAIVTGGARNLATLCAGRFIVGIASALSGIADVPYLTEISPPEYRGLLSSQYEILVCVGILVSFAADLIFESYAFGWRVAFIIPALLALLQSVGMCFLPDSPRWLMEKGKLDEAQRALTQIYGSQYLLYEIDSVFVRGSQRQRDDLPQDLADYQLAVAARDRLRAASDGGSSSKSLNTTHNRILATASYDSLGLDDDSEHETIVFRPGAASYSQVRAQDDKQPRSPITPPSLSVNKPGSALAQREPPVSHDSGLPLTASEQTVLREYELAIAVVVALQVLAQVTGANVIRNYAPTIFEASGVSATMSLTYNVMLGAVKLVFTVVSVYYTDSTGRRRLLLYGIVLVAVGMLFLALASAVSRSGNLSSPAVYTTGCALVYAGFGVGYGPIPWILSSEMFPTVVRGRVMSVSLLASNASQLVTNLVFLLMTAHATTAGTFGFFLVMNAATLLFVWLFLVETKEISPADILAHTRDRYRLVSNRFRALCSCCCGGAAKPYQELGESAHDSPHDDGGAASPAPINSLYAAAAALSAGQDNEERGADSRLGVGLGDSLHDVELSLE